MIAPEKMPGKFVAAYPRIPDEMLYPESDGKPMAETGFHVTLIAYLISMLRAFFQGRKDLYVGGNMFLYYEEGDPHKSLSPDVFIVFDVQAHERRSWFTWKEGKGPDVVFEFTSRSTRAEDQGSKKGLYEWMGIKEYFLFDPLDEYLQPRLQGFRLADGFYQPIPLIEEALESQQLGLTLKADGHLLRLSDTQTHVGLPLPFEMLTLLKAETEARQAEAEARQAEAEARQSAEAEVARLREELAKLRGDKS